jgi:hypothetical protein
MAADTRPPLLFHAGRFASLIPSREVSASIPEFW